LQLLYLAIFLACGDILSLNQLLVSLVFLSQLVDLVVFGTHCSHERLPALRDQILCLHLDVFNLQLQLLDQVILLSQ
jgi:hypothetical protein